MDGMDWNLINKILRFIRQLLWYKYNVNRFNQKQNLPLDQKLGNIDEQSIEPTTFEEILDEEEEQNAN